jgi:haloacid dehalogenase superfamily, subfamily IA, variant 1 with third motif having Dx(3-4)D or Dx(3-4)E
MKGYESYIFDLDNTLVDSSQGYTIAFSKAFEEYGIPYHEERYNEYIRMPFNTLFSQYHPNSPCKYRDFVSLIVSTYDKTHLDCVRLFPDAEACIDHLVKREKNLGIVSNSYTKHITGILSKLGILDLFSSVVGTDRVVMPKPDPEPVLLCMSEMGSVPENTIMVGDSDNDVIAGKLTGSDTALIDRTGVVRRDEAPTFNISSLSELIDIQTIW